MLSFRDFVPQQVRAPHLGLSADAVQGEYEPLQNALDRANQWIAESGVRVLNVETVLLPNLWSAYEHGSQDPVFGGPSGAPLWYQIIRVWHQVESG
jgi:hypothetical protein